METTTAAEVPAEVPADYAAREDLRSLEQRVEALAAVHRDTGTAAPASPLAQYRSFEGYARAVYRGDVSVRALADQITGDNPGVVEHGWVRDLKGIVDKGRRFVTALGAGSLPASGTSVAWPYYDGTLTDLVGVQATQKTAITSAEVNLKKGDEDIVTYAGGSDIALQLLERSDPSYLDAYLRIMALAWARVTEAAAVAAAEAAATGAASFEGDTPAALFTAIVDAAAKVEDATGMPPDGGLVAPAVWATYAGLLGEDDRPIFAPYAGPSNAPGGPRAPGALDLAIAGIPVVRGVVATTAPFIVTNRAAFQWLEDGPRNLAADDVEKLGRSVAIYSYAAPAAYVPTGIVKITTT